MPTLHKFKLLATQCAIAGSPTRSPTTSPVIHLRRRRTLRMFLSRPSDHRHHRIHDPPHEIPRDDAVRVRHKLKDLFVSSPPPPPLLQHDDDNSCRQQQQRHQEEQEGLLPGSAVGASFRRGDNAAIRPVSSAFRYRLLRRAWRPMLLTIPE